MSWRIRFLGTASKHGDLRRSEPQGSASRLGKREVGLVDRKPSKQLEFLVLLVFKVFFMVFEWFLNVFYRFSCFFLR